MFDDIAKNLVPAKKVGFTSVWIDAGYENFSDDIKSSKQYLDHETTNITEFLENVNKGNICCLLFPPLSARLSDLYSQMLLQ